MTKEEMITHIEQMTVLELAELVKALEERFGVTAAVSTVASPVEQVAEKEEEQTEFDVSLSSFGASKIAVIKVVRVLVDIGLKESKELVEALGTNIMSGIDERKAEEVKKKLEEAGAVVEIK